MENEKITVYSTQAEARRQGVTMFNLSWEQASADSNFHYSGNASESTQSTDFGVTNRQIHKSRIHEKWALTIILYGTFIQWEWFER